MSAASTSSAARTRTKVRRATEDQARAEARRALQESMNRRQ